MKSPCANLERSSSIKLTEKEILLLENLISVGDEEVIATDTRIMVKLCNALITTKKIAGLYRCYEQIRNKKSKGKFKQVKHYINFSGKVLFNKQAVLKDFGLWANARRY